MIGWTGLSTGHGTKSLISFPSATPSYKSFVIFSSGKTLIMWATTLEGKHRKIMP